MKTMNQIKALTQIVTTAAAVIATVSCSSNAGNSSGAGGSSGSSSGAPAAIHLDGGNNGNQADPCAVLNFYGSANANFNAAGVFSVSPVDTNNLSAITPLGNLNPPGHNYPTDHMYLQLKNSRADQNQVKAAAPGVVINAYQPGGPGTDWKLVIEIDQSFYYYYDHLHLVDGIQVGSIVAAGDVVATNSGDAAAVDFGVYNYNNAPLAGILDACLAESEAYVDSPLKYFAAGNLKNTLYALAGNTDGKIDYDQAGRLVGDWVLTGHKWPESPNVQLAFVYHVGSRSLRVAVGGTLSGGASTYAVQNGAPDFSTISVASGQVNYQLFQTTNGDSVVSNVQYGVLAVQMISDTQIKVQIFPGAQNNANFDGGAQIYSR